MALLLIQVGLIQVSAGQRRNHARHDVFVALPASRAPGAGPSPLPAGLNRVTPLTLTTTVRRLSSEGLVATRHLTVSRTAERVHVAMSDGREWLFERNDRDRRRARGSLIDHAARSIVAFDEHDLRSVLSLPGWASVAMLGCEVDFLAALRPTGQTRSIGGLRFDRYTLEQQHAIVGDVWWNDSQVLPGEFTMMEGPESIRFSIEQVQSGVDEALLQAPRIRFPSYRLVNRADLSAP